MATPQDATRPDQQPATKRRDDGGLRGLITSPALLCLPLALLAAAASLFVLGMDKFCYPWMIGSRPQLLEIYRPTVLPPIVLVCMTICCAAAAVLLAAALLGILVRRRWSIWTVRKTYVLIYLLAIVYCCIVFSITGRAVAALIEGSDVPAGSFVVGLFFWRCQWIAPVALAVIATVLLHVVSWRKKALAAYGADEEDVSEAIGERVTENVRTHGSDPRFRKSLYGSAFAHVMVILIIPYLLTIRGGCVRPFHAPKGSGKPSVAMVKVVKKKKKKKRKKYILSADSPIVYDVPELDDSKLVEELDEDTRVTYTADTSAAHGAMGTGGGNKPGWADGLEGGQIRFAQLQYNGADWDDGMTEGADVNFLAQFRKLSGGLDVARQGEAVPVSLLRKFKKGEAPWFVYMTGSDAIHMSNSEIKILRQYVNDGGMLLADAGSPQWDHHFRRFVKELFPGKPLIPIADDDPIFITPFTFHNGPPPLWHHGGEQSMGVKFKGRWGVFYFPGDLNDAWKSGHSGLSPELTEAAYHLGTNLVYYGVTRYLQATRKDRK